MEVLELKLQVFGITGLQYIPDRIDDGCFACVVFPTNAVTPGLKVTSKPQLAWPNWRKFSSFKTDRYTIRPPVTHDEAGTPILAISANAVLIPDER